MVNFIYTILIVIFAVLLINWYNRRSERTTGIIAGIFWLVIIVGGIVSTIYLKSRNLSWKDFTFVNIIHSLGGFLLIIGALSLPFLILWLIFRERK